MSTLHPRLRELCLAADASIFNKWDTSEGRCCVAYDLSEADPAYLDVTLFNKDGSSCCFRLEVELRSVTTVFDWPELVIYTPLHRAPSAPRPQADTWVDSGEEEFV